MLNPNYTITSYNANQAIVTWSANAATDVSYVFVNGALILGNFQFSTVERTMLIPFKQSKSIILEIHDFDVPQENIIAITEKSNKLPLISWNSVDSAVKYKVYANNKLLYTVKKQEDVAVYKKQIVDPEFYGKIWAWHFFTVTSVDSFGNESLIEYFPYFIWDLPPLINELLVSNGSGSGLYDFTIIL
jgi:hypothetical protein